MNINVEHKPNCRVVLHVEVPADTVKQARNEIVSHFCKVANVPGYRPGKVPPQIILQRYKDAVNSEMEDRLVNQGCSEAIQRENLEVLQVLTVKDRVVTPAGSFTFTAEVSTAPKFELPDYTGIPVKISKVVVTDHDVEHELFHLRENQAKFDDVERPAQMGDAVVLNYEVSMEGSLLSETHADLPVHFHKIEGNWFLLDATEDFLPGFYAGLAGITKDESRTLSIALPEDFHTESLRGKTIDIAATCTAVKQKSVPPLDEAFAKSFLGDEGTLEQLRDLVRKSVESRKQKTRDDDLTNQILAHLHDKTLFEVPDDIVVREAQRRTNDIARQAAERGMSDDELLKQQDEIIKSATIQATQSVRVSFILDKVAQKEQLEASQNEIMDRLGQIASRSRQSPKKFMAEAQRSGLVDRVREDIRLNHALQFLKDSAAVEEVEPEDDKHDCAFEKGEAA